MTRQWTRVCKVCSKRFRPPLIWHRGVQEISSRRTCSNTCAHKLVKSTGTKWTQEEDEMLIELAGSSPKDQIVRTFKKYAVGKRQRPRTHEAIRIRANRLGLSLVPEVGMLSIQKIAHKLGVDADRVRYWKKLGLRITYKTKTGHYISEEEIARFARSRPDRFSGIKYERLMEVIGSIELCRFIVLNYPKRVEFLMKARRVMCTDTQDNTRKVFPSIYAASKDPGIHLSKSSIERSLRLKVESCGYRFEYFD